MVSGDCVINPSDDAFPVPTSKGMLVSFLPCAEYSSYIFIYPVFEKMSIAFFSSISDFSEAKEIDG